MTGATEDQPYKWKDELESMTMQWNKLVLGYKDTVPGSDMSYKDLNTALPEVMTNLPDSIEVAQEEPEEVE